MFPANCTEMEGELGVALQQDDYDPVKPNDYELFVAQKEQKAREAMIAQQLKQKQEGFVLSLSPPPCISDSLFVCLLLHWDDNGKQCCTFWNNRV